MMNMIQSQSTYYYMKLQTMCELRLYADYLWTNEEWNLIIPVLQRIHELVTYFINSSQNAVYNKIDCGIVWIQLGNVHSNLTRYTEASRYYQRAYLELVEVRGQSDEQNNNLDGLILYTESMGDEAVRHSNATDEAYFQVVG
jgi:hypothetical protein